MDEIEKEFKAVKDKLFASAGSSSQREIYTQLTKIGKNASEVDEKIQELLALIYSSYKAELDLMKLNYLEINQDMLQANLRLVQKLKTLLENGAHMNGKSNGNRTNNNANASSNNDHDESITIGHDKQSIWRMLLKLVSSMPGFGKTIVAITFLIIVFLIGYEIAPDGINALKDTIKLLFKIG